MLCKAIAVAYFSCPCLWDFLLSVLSSKSMLCCVEVRWHLRPFLCLMKLLGYFCTAVCCEAALFLQYLNDSEHSTALYTSEFILLSASDHQYTLVTQFYWQSCHNTKFDRWCGMVWIIRTLSFPSFWYKLILLSSKTLVSECNSFYMFPSKF